VDRKGPPVIGFTDADADLSLAAGRRNPKDPPH
jgi:hypothetical protein